MSQFNQYAVLMAENRPSEVVRVRSVDPKAGTAEVEYPDGRTSVTVADCYLRYLRQVNVPTSHFNDFIQHPGTWATFNDPGIRDGDQFIFALQGAPAHYMEAVLAKAKDCHQINGGQRPQDINWLRTTKNSLDGWWLLTYDGWFSDPPPPVYGDERQDDEVNLESD